MLVVWGEAIVEHVKESAQKVQLTLQELGYTNQVVELPDIQKPSFSSRQSNWLK